MAWFRKSVSLYRNKRLVPDLDASVEALEEWFATPLGQQLLETEQRIVSHELSCMFGYHLMQLSVTRQLQLYKDSRINHCFSVGVGSQAPGSDVGVFASLDALPIEDESIDVTILHHVLEFSSNPHQVLKEASRVTIPRGYIVVLGFNPVSPMGLVKPLAQLFSSSPIWKRNSLFHSRVSDWLQFLDCNTIRKHSGVYNLPVQNKRYLDYSKRVNTWLQKRGVPFGNFYCLVARKDRATLRPIRPDWSAQPRFKAAKQALSARSAARLALVKSKTAPRGSNE